MRAGDGMHLRRHLRKRPERRGSEVVTPVMQLRAMDAEFTTIVDRPNGTLRVTLGGFFSHADVAAFVFDLHLKLDLLRCGPNEHLMLCDVRAMKIQTQDIVSVFSTVVGAPRLRSKRLAFVTGSSLSRLQAKRLTHRPGVSFFSDVADAENWLFDGCRDSPDAAVQLEPERATAPAARS